MWVFVTDFLLSTKRFQGSSLYFLLLKNISLNIYTSFCLAIYDWVLQQYKIMRENDGL